MKSIHIPLSFYLRAGVGSLLLASMVLLPAQRAYPGMLAIPTPPPPPPPPPPPATTPPNQPASPAFILQVVPPFSTNAAPISESLLEEANFDGLGWDIFAMSVPDIDMVETLRNSLVDADSGNEADIDQLMAQLTDVVIPEGISVANLVDAVNTFNQLVESSSDAYLEANAETLLDLHDFLNQMMLITTTALDSN
jgi:hypothetical protein